MGWRECPRRRPGSRNCIVGRRRGTCDRHRGEADPSPVARTDRRRRGRAATDELSSGCRHVEASAAPSPIRTWLSRDGCGPNYRHPNCQHNRSRQYGRRMAPRRRPRRSGLGRPHQSLATSRTTSARRRRDRLGTRGQCVPNRHPTGALTNCSRVAFVAYLLRPENVLVRVLALGA